MAGRYEWQTVGGRRYFVRVGEVEKPSKKAAPKAKKAAPKAAVAEATPETPADG